MKFLKISSYPIWILKSTIAKYFQVSLDNFQKLWMLHHLSAVYLWIYNNHVSLSSYSISQAHPTTQNQMFIDVQVCPFFGNKKPKENK